MTTPYLRYVDDMRYRVIDDRLAMMDLGLTVLGECIGNGDTRTVYNYGLDDSMVVKVELGNTHNNTLEFEIWSDVKRDDHPLKPWLAPARFLSQCGRFLFMDKTSKVINWPKTAPRALFDLHTGNFGMLKGKFVCHDYANVTLLNDPQGARPKAVKWRIGRH